MSAPIRAKDRDTVLQALRAGVVPRVGQHLIQVGRAREIEALITDIGRLSEGGSAIRMVIGEYGAGKTFFLNLVRAIAMQNKLVTASADLNPDRRLHATGGQARSLYAELMRNLSTRTKPDGGAMAGIVEKFIATAKTEALAANKSTELVIREKLNQLTEMVNGFDFADVIAAYCRGVENGEDELKANAIRWLRGEFTTKTDARNALGVRTPPRERRQRVAAVGLGRPHRGEAQPLRFLDRFQRASRRTAAPIASVVSKLLLACHEECLAVAIVSGQRRMSHPCVTVQRCRHHRASIRWAGRFAGSACAAPTTATPLAIRRGQALDRGSNGCRCQR